MSIFSERELVDIVRFSSFSEISFQRSVSYQMYQYCKKKLQKSQKDLTKNQSISQLLKKKISDLLTKNQELEHKLKVDKIFQEKHLKLQNEKLSQTTQQL